MGFAVSFYFTITKKNGDKLTVAAHPYANVVRYTRAKKKEHRLLYNRKNSRNKDEKKI